MVVLITLGNRNYLISSLMKHAEINCICSVVIAHPEWNTTYSTVLIHQIFLVTHAESLDVLESWVVELFDEIKKAPRVPTNFKIEGPIWKAGKVYRLEAVKDVHVLDLSWTLPSLRQDYLKKSEDYLAHLLGHGNNSISSVLVLSS